MTTVGAKNLSPLQAKTHRRSIRLCEYDYSQEGAYFVTLCTQNREALFGQIVDGVMCLNAAGKIVEQCWHNIPTHFPRADLDNFVIMPNHVHGIIIITDKPFHGTNVGTKDFSPLPPHGTSKTLGSIVRGFKIGVTKWLRTNTRTHDVWQRNYWEHIVRDELELGQIREYIQNNPAQWSLDEMNPERSL